MVPCSFLGGSVFVFVTLPPRHYQPCGGSHRTALGGMNPGKVTLCSLLSPAPTSPQPKGSVVGGLEGKKEP